MPANVHGRRRNGNSLFSKTIALFNKPPGTREGKISNEGFVTPTYGGASAAAAKLSPALSQRVWSIGRRGGPGRCHLFLLRHGRAAYHSAEAQDLEIVAPALLWLPRRATGAFALAAGGEGAMVDVKEDMVWRAVGDSAIAHQLRTMLDRLVVAPADRMGAQLAEFNAIFEALARETSQPAPGGAAMIELYLGVMLVHLWRASGGVSETSQRGAATTLAQQFLQLVEIHYRDHLSVEDFARRLRAPRSSLHEACLKARGRTPLRLLHDRLVEEARNRLATTDLPIEQVGFGLGFRDPGYFNRFFQRLTGMTPGAFRKTTVRGRAKDPHSFAAWP